MSILKPHNIPEAPGVYVFKKSHKPLYIGKASSLKARLGSYFLKNVGEKVGRLLDEADEVTWVETVSEVEALIKESELIKLHVPKFNVVMRDDKSYFYVAITGFRRGANWRGNAKMPRIFLTHQVRNLKPNAYNLKPRIIGPFTSGSALKITLRLLRDIFPYCTCKEIHKRPCLNTQIGRCPGLCCDKNLMQKENGKMQNTLEYKNNIQNIGKILTGKRKKLLVQLKREVKTVSAKQEYEKAAKLRDQISGIENIFSHSLVLRERGSFRNKDLWQWKEIQETIKNLFGIDKNISRVEGYDISNISGAEATGSMAVFVNGKPDKSQYRKFKIKTVHQISDIDMHKEMMRRRLAHSEWPYPDIILIDGGRGQLNVALRELKITNDKLRTKRIKIKVIALAKREEELYLENRVSPIRLRSLPFETASFFQRVRDESHRFAKKYHHKLREMKLRKEIKNR